MEFIKKDDITVLQSDYQDSLQLLWNENSKSERLSITKVYVYPGKSNLRHQHDHNEQVWIALYGTGTLLLANNGTQEFSAGDVARFSDNEVHGITNNMDEEFIYIAVTAPPINFRYAYNRDTVTVKELGRVDRKI